MVTRSVKHASWKTERNWEWQCNESFKRNNKLRLGCTETSSLDYRRLLEWKKPRGDWENEQVQKEWKTEFQLKCTKRVWKRFMRTPQMALCKRLGNKQTLLGQHECTDSKNGQKSLPLCKVPETEAPGGYDNLWCTQQSLAATGNWCIWTWRKPPPADNWLLQLFFWN